MESLQILSRSEMRNINGGLMDFEECTCYNISGQPQGKVLCSEDIDRNQCCQVQHEETFAANCS